MRITNLYNSIHLYSHRTKSMIPEILDPDSLLLSSGTSSLNSRDISKEIASEKGLDKTGALQLLFS